MIYPSIYSLDLLYGLIIQEVIFFVKRFSPFFDNNFFIFLCKIKKTERNILYIIRLKRTKKMSLINLTKVRKEFIINLYFTARLLWLKV